MHFTEVAMELPGEEDFSVHKGTELCPFIGSDSCDYCSTPCPNDVPAR
jgi:hypothetical protein